MSTCQMAAALRRLYAAIFLPVDEKHSKDHHHFPKIASLALMFALMSRQCAFTSALVVLSG